MSGQKLRNALRSRRKPGTPPESPGDVLEAVLSQAGLARLFGVTTRTVARWTELGLPRNQNGRAGGYPLGACVRWVLAREQDQAAQRPRLKDEQAGLVRARRELAEITLAERRRGLVPVTTARTAIRDVATLIRAGIIAFPGREAYRWQAARSHEEALLVLEDLARGLLEHLQDLMRSGAVDRTQARARPARRA